MLAVRRAKNLEASMQTLAVMPGPEINDTLPDNLKSIRARPMFVMRLDVARPPQVVGYPPEGYRRTSIIRDPHDHPQPPAPLQTP